ncbi:hypothetical protein OAQ80_05875 [Flavobacteriaceae bacterium]|nr:hypothetical protein [Flavobacteriaceae bacterium]
MKRLFFPLLIIAVLSFILVQSCSTDEENTVAQIVQTQEPEGQVNQYTLTVTSAEGGTVSSDGGTYDEGTEVTITASANEGYRFTGWEGNDSTSENLTITLNSNQTYQALFELLPLDSDGDGIVDSEDYKPYNPFLTYDDWGESKDEYSELFYTSDISELDIEGMIRDFRMIEDNLGKFGGEFYFIGPDIEAALELAKTYCTRKVERGQLYYYDGSSLPDGYTLEQIHSACMSEMMAPHAPTDWTDTNGSFFTNDLANHIGIFERYRRAKVEGAFAGGGIANRNWNLRGAYYTSPQGYDPLTYKEGTPTWAYSKFLLIEFVPYIYAIYNDSRETFVDVTGNTKRLGGGPDWISGGRNFFLNYILRKWHNEGIYTLPSWAPNTITQNLRDYMSNVMSKVQEQYLTCPNFRLEDLFSSGVPPNGSCTYYEIGAWAHAYLSHKVGNPSVFTKVLMPKVNALGFDNAFQETFGLDFDQLNIEFKDFLSLPLEQQLEIIPDI